MDDLILAEVLTLEPFNCCLTFLIHIRNDGSLIEILACVDGTVKEDNLYASLLSVVENVVPACCVSCGKEQIVNAVLNELLSLCDLLVVLEAVRELSVIAVLIGECSLQVLIVSCTIAGLVRVVVDDADLDLLVAAASAAAVSAVRLAGAAVSTACH